jgi:hypothetical protein
MNISQFYKLLSTVHRRLYIYFNAPFKSFKKKSMNVSFRALYKDILGLLIIKNYFYKSSFFYSILTL